LFLDSFDYARYETWVEGLILRGQYHIFLSHLF
ncbi:MAG: hypothetical protein K0R24_2433, partial [Gammaproteobacteria bacterium]|nr:hypothetical protein [Gammaproteobacteria bacterium]